MQHEVTKAQPLLDEKGNIAEPGYAKKMIWKYDRDDIKAGKAKIKEWDYYYISNGRVGLCLTISDLGYVGGLSATVLEFEGEPWQITKTDVPLFPMGKTNMPSTSVRGDIHAKHGKVDMTFLNDGKDRNLFGVYPAFGKNGEDLKFDINISDIPAESMVIATPFDKNKHFYFNQKINCMTAWGTFSIGDKKYVFDKADTLATLDWGRGVWTYSNTWYWGSLQTRLADGSTFGFNIGYGFGNTSAASENMLFYNGTSHKFENVDFGIPGDAEGAPRYMEQWHFTSSDGRLEMTFDPVIDRYEPFDVKLIKMIPHQVFGKFNGTAILDDGRVIEIKDAMGFAEKVHNQW